jgi:hypothetical protein
MRLLYATLLAGLIFPFAVTPSQQLQQKKATKSLSSKQQIIHAHRTPGLPSGKPIVWEDRGALTPSKVYWGSAGGAADPLARLPSPPYSHFEQDTTSNATSPKARLTDSKGIKWTVKFGEEIHSDVAAPRLAQAMGFGTVESYFVPGGKVEGITTKTDLGAAHGWIKPDGTFDKGARFKRHNKEETVVTDSANKDMTWTEAENPGVPPEHLSGLLILDVLINNWDAQRKNCKVYHVDGKNGPQNWFIISDYGASFADKPFHKYNLSQYQKEQSFIKDLSGGFVNLIYASSVSSQAKLHGRIPLAHAQWFRKQLEKLTDDDIQASFDAASATDALNHAYMDGNAEQIKQVRDKELPLATRNEIAGFIAAVRSKIKEYLQKIPAGTA